MGFHPPHHCNLSATRSVASLQFATVYVQSFCNNDAASMRSCCNLRKLLQSLCNPLKPFCNCTVASLKLHSTFSPVPAETTLHPLGSFYVKSLAASLQNHHSLSSIALLPLCNANTVAASLQPCYGHFATAAALLQPLQPFCILVAAS
jgi:hypothetical protein